MIDQQKKFWMQPDADVRGLWTVCVHPDDPRLVQDRLPKDEAREMVDRLNERAADGQSPDHDPNNR